MKKLLVAAALIGAVSYTSFGQGQITFANTGTTLVSTNSTAGGAATGNASAALGSFVYGLFVAPSTVTTVGGLTDANWTFTGNYATNTTATSGGRLQGGQPGIPGYAGGSTANIIVRGWSGDLGQDWTAVLQWYNNGNPARTEWIGTSGVAVGVLLNTSPSPISPLFGVGPNLIAGFTLNRVDPVPEPTTFALAGLGAAAMLIFRRRK